MTSNISRAEDASALQLAYQRLLALERFKSGFLARTSHELRSPINTIVSLHQLILEDLCEGPEEEKEFIQQSKAAALKMLTLFDQIAAVSKLDIGREPPKLEAVDLSFLLPEVEMLTALQAANQNVRYTVEAPPDELAIYTDAKWLKNVLASLIQDAIPHSKRLRLTVEQGEQSVVVVIECDRTATFLQNELDTISSNISDNISDNRTQSSNLPDSLSNASAAKNTASNALQSAQNISIEDIQLSTGLILATAHTTLPLINGTFALTPHPNDKKRCRLGCSFSRIEPI
jgi:K+-sensing histidine kinase KdpD